MGDFIRGATVIADALVGLAASPEFIRAFLGLALIAGFLLAIAAVAVGILTIARIGLAAVVRLAMRETR